MSLLFCFDHFNPVTGKVPKIKEEIFLDAATRARAILKDFDAIKLESAIKTLLWLIDEGTSIYKMEDIQLKLPGYYTYSKALTKAMDCYRLSPNRNDSINWHEYFALLSLAIIGEACSIIAHAPYPKNKIPRKVNSLYIESQKDLAAQAMEAIAIAESLMRELQTVNRTKTEIEAENKKKKSLNAQKGGIAKHQKTKNAVKQLVLFHDQHSYSKRQSTKRFIEKFPEVVAHLSKDACFETLYNNLNKERPAKRQRA